MLGFIRIILELLDRDARNTKCNKHGASVRGGTAAG
jgi:hypothetical protein